MSKEALRLIEADRYEYGVIVNALICFYETLKKEGKDLDFIIEVLDKVSKAPYKKSRFKYAIEKWEEKQ